MLWSRPPRGGRPSLVVCGIWVCLDLRPLAVTPSTGYQKSRLKTLPAPHQRSRFRLAFEIRHVPAPASPESQVVVEGESISSLWPGPCGPPSNNSKECYSTPLKKNRYEGDKHEHSSTKDLCVSIYPPLMRFICSPLHSCLRGPNVPQIPPTPPAQRPGLRLFQPKSLIHTLQIWDDYG